MANVKALAREKYFDGLAIVRTQDNYVVQLADPEAEKPERARKIQVWILAPQRRRRKSRKVLSDDYSRSSGAARQSCVLGIRNESELSRTGSFDTGDTGDFGGRRAVFETYI